MILPLNYRDLSRAANEKFKGVTPNRNFHKLRGGFVHKSSRQKWRGKRALPPILKPAVARLHHIKAYRACCRNLQIEAVAIDMWKPYINTVEEQLPEADIVHDKFHIAKYLGEAVDKVRKSEHKGLKKEGSETLKGTKYLWLTNPRNWSGDQKRQFKKLKDKGLQVGRAWAIKELFSALWEYTYEKSARNFFRKWYWWATHSRLKPIAEVARKLKRHLDNILTYLRHRITNTVAEGINSKIQQIKSAARGFRNFENYRTAILFFCGKLAM